MRCSFVSINSGFWLRSLISPDAFFIRPCQNIVKVETRRPWALPCQDLPCSGPRLGIGKLLAQNAALNFEWTTSARKRLRGYAEGVYELSI